MCVRVPELIMACTASHTGRYNVQIFLIPIQKQNLTLALDQQLKLKQNFKTLIILYVRSEHNEREHSV